MRVRVLGECTQTSGQGFRWMSIDAERSKNAVHSHHVRQPNLLAATPPLAPPHVCAPGTTQNKMSATIKCAQLQGQHTPHTMLPRFQQQTLATAAAPWLQCCHHSPLPPASGAAVRHGLGDPAAAPEARHKLLRDGAFQGVGVICGRRVVEGCWRCRCRSGRCWWEVLTTARTPCPDAVASRGRLFPLVLASPAALSRRTHRRHRGSPRSPRSSWRW